MEIAEDRTTELNRLFCVYKNLLKMMMDRGYFVPAFYKNIDFADFEEGFRKDAPVLPFFNRLNEEERIYVFFASNPNKFTKEDLRSRLEIMNNMGVNNAIIILQGETSVNLAEFEETYRIEFFKEEEILVDIMEQELFSDHILLSNDEKINLLKRYQMRESQLPKLPSNDLAARYYGLKRGDVVKIIRESKTVGRYVTYRLVS